MKPSPRPRSKSVHTTITRYPDGRIVGAFPAHAWNHRTTAIAIIALVVLGLVFALVVLLAFVR